MVELEATHRRADMNNDKPQQSNTQWHGRYEAAAADSLRSLNDSLPFDKRMVAEDIRGSIAWARALGLAGILNAQETTAITSGLEKVRAEFEAGAFTFAAGDEDIHTAVERRLTELIGAVAGKLHTGRSRNDQVATDFRLWVHDAVGKLYVGISDLIRSLAEVAGSHTETLMPGYTHMRAAQPITTAHWLMSYVEMLSRDLVQIAVALDFAGESPLGSSALAGTPYPVDRKALAIELGFFGPTQNSLDGVSDRDFAASFLFAASMLMIHLSRFAEDVILYSSPQFGFIDLDERYTTGSSIMPQKQNPDIFELARGKAGRVIGNLTGFLVTYKGLPSSYNKDLQEDKEPVFDAADTLLTLLPAITGAVQTLRFNPEKMRAALDEGMLATDVADYLVMRGVPFREAHGIVGKLVRRSLETNTLLSKLPFEVYQSLSPAFQEDVYEVYDFMSSVRKRNQIGGTAPEAVRQQINLARRAFSDSNEENP